MGGLYKRVRIGLESKCCSSEVKVEEIESTRQRRHLGRSFFSL